MCIYCKAASTVLDMLWESPTARDYFHQQGADLPELGAIVHEVFVPAYRSFKDRQDVAMLARYDAEVSHELLAPLREKASFREAWQQWGDSTRNAFMREQFENKLAVVLMRHYGDELFEAYKSAYAVHRAQPAQHR
jgi:hypothetical protein